MTTSPLVDDPAFTYVCPNGRPTRRHLRLWATTDGGRAAIVTEQWNDPGMSITNAAEKVHAAITATYGLGTAVIEHYPNTPGWPHSDPSGEEHFTQIHLTPDGTPRWTHIPRQLLLASINLDNYPSKPA